MSKTNNTKFHLRSQPSPLKSVFLFGQVSLLKYIFSQRKKVKLQHITSGCEKLAQIEYKRRYNIVAKKVHWDICKKNRLEHSEKWYEHAPEVAVEMKRSKYFRA